MTEYQAKLIIKKTTKTEEVQLVNSREALCVGLSNSNAFKIYKYEQDPEGNKGVKKVLETYKKVKYMKDVHVEVVRIDPEEVLLGTLYVDEKTKQAFKFSSLETEVAFVRMTRIKQGKFFQNQKPGIALFNKLEDIDTALKAAELAKINKKEALRVWRADIDEAIKAKLKDSQGFFNISAAANTQGQYTGAYPLGCPILFMDVHTGAQADDQLKQMKKWLDDKMKQHVGE